MSNWSTHRRETSLIEHICEHGVGHPNAGSMLRMDEIHGEGSKGTWGVHGCDGCCARDDFPGSPINTMLFSLKLYANKCPWELHDIAEAIRQWPFMYYALKALANEHLPNYPYKESESNDA